MSNNVINGGLGYKGERGDDGVSPVITTSKTDGVATITITDVEGTKTVQLSDGELTKAMVVDNLTTTTTDVPLSAKQGKVLNDNKIDKNIIEVLTGTITINSANHTGVEFIEFPSNFSKSNCVIIGGKITSSAGSSRLINSYTLTNGSFSSYVEASFESDPYDDIQLVYYNEYGSAENPLTANYEIVLMKIS